MVASMFRPAVLRSAQRFATHQSRQQQARGFSVVPPNLLNQWYNTFGKSTAMYASWLVMFIVVGEYATGKMTDALWTSHNYGKTFTTVDWSKFDQFEEESGGGGGDDDEDDDE